MEGTPRLYDTSMYLLSQHQNRVDPRQLNTPTGMLAGLIQAEKSRLQETAMLS